MPLHPLEPLAASEVMQAVSLLKAVPCFTPTTRIISIMLREPNKTAVYEWNETEEGVRAADAVLFDNSRNAAFTVWLDITANAIVECRQRRRERNRHSRWMSRWPASKLCWLANSFAMRSNGTMEFPIPVWSWSISGAPATMGQKRIVHAV